MTTRSFLLFLAAALLLPLTGCQTGSFPAPTAQWETYSGQMHYAGSSSVVGEVVVRRSGKDFQLDFSSGPGFPLMRFRVSGQRTHGEGVLARKGFTGWLALPAAFAAVAPEKPVATGAGYRAEGEYQERLLEHLTVLNTATGERFTFHFSR